MASPSFARCAEKTAFVVGYTGAVGKEVVRELLEKRIFKKLYLIGRRTVQYDDPLYSSTEQKVVDFDNLENHKDVFRDIEYGFCCLGTTRGTAGATGFVKIEHDYVVGTAKVAKEGGCQRFSIVSADNANKDNKFVLYIRTKGLAEHHVTEVGFQKFTIARPGFLISDRQELRVVEKVAGWVLKPIIWAKPTYMSIPVQKVAKAMIYNMCTDPIGEPVEILGNRKLHEVADIYDNFFENKQ